MATIRPLKLPGAPDQELMEQGASRHSRSRALGPLEQAGLLNKRDHCGEHGSWAPGAGWGPRSRANGAPWSKQGLQIKRQWAPRARGSKSRVNGAPSGSVQRAPAGPLYGGPSRAFIQRIPDGPSGGGPSAGPSDCRPQPGSQTAGSSRHRPGPQSIVTGRTFIRRAPGRANIMRPRPGPFKADPD